MGEPDRRIHFVSGLPRSGSTLLVNVLGQNPRFYVTPTSGIVDMLIQARNHWDRNDAFRAHRRQDSELLKLNVLRGMLFGYFAHTERPVCFDKSRFWTEYLEMAAALLGGRERVKVLVTVRDLRDVVASFERLFRKTSALGQIPQDANNPIKFKTALGRVDTFIDNTQPVGRAFSAIHDAVVRGWRPCMHFVEYEALTREPEKTLREIYRFLGEDPYPHDFGRVEQITFEDDLSYGFKDLHIIRPVIEPQEPYWQQVFDKALFSSKTWKNIENVAQFWRSY